MHIIIKQLTVAYLVNNIILVEKRFLLLSLWKTIRNTKLFEL